MSTHIFSDTSVMLGRSLRHVTRSMDTIITVTIMPIAFMLLFVYVFGGAIKAGAGHYVNYLMPGILLIAIASGIAYTAFRLFTDLQSGIFERFHSMPIARSAVLWGHVLTSLVANMISVVVIVAVGLLIGFRSSAGVLAWLAVDVENITVGRELAVVAIGRTDQHHHCAALRHCLPVVGDVPGDITSDMWSRRLEAQQFLDGCGDQRRVFDQLMPLVGMLSQNLAGPTD